MKPTPAAINKAPITPGPIRVETTQRAIPASTEVIPALNPLKKGPENAFFAFFPNLERPSLALFGNKLQKADAKIPIPLPIPPTTNLESLENPFFAFSSCVGSRILSLDKLINSKSKNYEL